MRIKISQSFTIVPNMIPTIDILFQLVIFFMLACQFAVIEQFPISVPDECSFAMASGSDERAITMVTLMKSPSAGGIELAVGADKKIATEGGAMMATEIAELVNEKRNRVVCLRIAKDIPFEQSQYALKGVAQSAATDIQMSVLKEKDIKEGPSQTK